MRWYLLCETIITVYNGDSRKCVHWYFTKKFLELSFHFFSKSKGRILDELRFSFNFNFPSFERSYNKVVHDFSSI